MDVRVVDHPLAAARLTTLRDERTDNAAFRAALRDLTLMLVYEATRDAATESVPCARRWPTPSERGWPTPPLLVPVLRAGLGHGRSGARADPRGARSASSASPATRRPTCRRRIWSRCPTI